MIYKTEVASKAVHADFQRQLEKWAIDEYALPTPDVVHPLIGCTEPLPVKYCEILGIAPNSTYGDAAEEFAPGGVYVVDLHGYLLWQAIEVAETAIQSAQAAGFESIRLIHGAPDVKTLHAAKALGRGVIKWSLRGYLACGDWSRFVYPRRSVKHSIGDGSMTLALRPNPAPAVSN